MRAAAFQAYYASDEPRYRCPACQHHIYPKLTPSLLPHWAHIGSEIDGARPHCAFGDSKRISWAKLDALIYRGRQEGLEHFRLVDQLAELLSFDKFVDPLSISKSRYIPSAKLGERGRFPDITFSYGRHKVAFEVQTSPITLHRFFERAAFYRQQQISLIWITRSFTPTPYARTWLWDVIGGQGGIAFSIDTEVDHLIRTNLNFQIRRYHSFTDRYTWSEDLVSLDQIINAPIPFYAEFKERWIGAANSCWSDAIDLIDALAKKANTKTQINKMQLAATINSLIVIERWLPIGSLAKNPISIIHSLLDSHVGPLSVAIIEAALREYKPDVLLRPKTREIIGRAKLRASEDGVVVWGRKSVIGQFRDVLFPGWLLSRGE